MLNSLHVCCLHAARSFPLRRASAVTLARFRNFIESETVVCQVRKQELTAPRVFRIDSSINLDRMRHFPRRERVWRIDHHRTGFGQRRNAFQHLRRCVCAKPLLVRARVPIRRWFSHIASINIHRHDIELGVQPQPISRQTPLTRVEPGVGTPTAG